MKFPDGFPGARILLQWKDHLCVAPGFIGRPSMQPVRSRRGEDALACDDAAAAGEPGGRDGAAQIVDEVVDPAWPGL